MKKEQRKKYLIDKKLQFKYIGVTFTKTVLIILVVVFYLVWNVDKVTDLMTKFDFNVQQEIALWRNAFLLKLGLVVVGLIILDIVLSILISHKVAGVVYKIENGLESISRGDFPEVMVRKGDELNSLVDKFNLLVKNLKGYRSKVELASEQLKILRQQMGQNIADGQIFSKEDIANYSNNLKEIQEGLETFKQGDNIAK